MQTSIEKLAAVVVDVCIKIHKRVGPGCFERVYEEILYYELVKLGYKVQRQITMPIEYDELYIPDAYKLDLIVEEQVIVEIKSVELMHNVHKKQLLTYLRLSNKKLGLLVNFNSDKLIDKESIIRIIN
jgi:GxxExxY protein